MSIFRAVAYSLTGHILQDDPASSPSAVIAALAKQGWEHDELDSFRQECHGRRWPLTISPKLRGDAGAAQLRAVTQAVIAELSLGEPPRLRDASMPLDAHDRALLAEVPPHHGKVG